MSKEFESTCPSCAKPITTKNAKVPNHNIKVVRGGKPTPVKCPGSGETPN